MAKHVSDLSQLKTMLADLGIKEGHNLDKLTMVEDEAQLFQNQQIVLENCLHSCDVSIPARDFETVKDWTYLLFEEFFQQGDLEKERGLPISMLCDRTTTNVAKSQPGFIGFVSLPLFNNLTNIMPILHEEVDRMKQNSNTWKNYEETEEDKKVYIQKAGKSKVIEVTGVEEEHKKNK